MAWRHLAVCGVERPDDQDMNAMSGSTSAISAAARPHLASLTSLRFLAAFLIVLFHNGDSIASRAPAWVGNMIEGGPVGVGLFFVLSGFILVYSTSTSTRVVGANREISGRHGSPACFPSTSSRLS